VTDDSPHHPIRLWLSEHDGWEAWVAQLDDGTFMAWACRGGENAEARYIEDTFEHACAAAGFDLARLSHHETCGPNCTAWQEREAPADAHEHPKPTAED
jgi:hypothetical protein